MKIVIAPDSFKESLSALEVAEAVERGFRTVFPEGEYVKVPMADGGEGTVRSLVDATGGRIVETEVTGPLGEPVRAFFGLLGDGKTAVIEMAAASGLHLVPRDRRNPLVTTTRGTGELILAALDAGATHLIIGIGGSATNDGGAGMVQALGGRLLDEDGCDIGPGGGALADLHAIDLSGLDPRLGGVRIDVACDVDNPLTGPNGASAIFGPQKGATPDMVAVLDRNLAHYADVIRRDLGKQVGDIPGAGAAGGLGAGLLAFLPAELKRGVEIVIETVQLAERVKDADLVITGEGRIDGQTVFGKTPIGVAKTAKQFGVPVIGIAALFTIVPGVVPLEKALEQAEHYVTQTARHIASVYRLGQIGKQFFR
ncbi:glycerate kinase [Geobacillus thermoleovorans]|uniref:Glycerate kinase n=1 Tax=Geobacillus thermoleovorans TaxID=33941 RepID=A0A2Z3N6A3_GEOTH|nr:MULTISPECIES: glycerate kinase [Geobacillus]AWO74406.1 glycerate kinase [Geobacillus thermoleovorans]